MKKFEKAPPPLRDYLDMDTDEEEFGRQETPEPDEELPPEPEKPVFTGEEMRNLIDQVKNLVCSCDTRDNFSENSIDVIREYFCYPVHTILTIFKDANEYKALLDFPSSSINCDLTYFMRSPWQIYTPDNFMKTVIFGNISRNKENSLLKFFSNIYAPEAFGNKEWPKVTQNEIFSILNGFLTHLTDAAYNPMGLTKLYIPREGLKCVKSSGETTADNHQFDSSDNDDSTTDNQNVTGEIFTLLTDDDMDDNFIERLEKVACYWIKQIREVLKGSNLPPRSIYRTIADEIKFWNFRFDSLNCLRYQLSNKYILAIVEALINAKSASVDQFYLLAREIEKLLGEVSSGINYLNVFNGFEMQFQIPDGTDEYTKSMVHLIRFIGKESEFYKCTDKIEALCQALGTEIIVQCKKYINLNTVLKGNPNNGKIMLKNSINCCIEYQKIFNELQAVDKHDNFNTISKVDGKNIFRHVNTFTQRCMDLIEITDTRIIFDKNDEEITMCGVRAPEYEVKYSKIEKLFIDALDNVKQVQNCILDVSAFVWLEKMFNFRKKIQDIDTMMNNLINQIFDDVTNVDEGVETLFCLRRFAIHKNFKKLLDKHWGTIWDIFHDEIDYFTADLKTKEFNYYHTSLTPYAGLAILWRQKNKYLTRQYNVLINASDWFGDYVGQKKIIDKYKEIHNILSEKSDNLFTKWEETLVNEEEIKAALDRPLIKYGHYPKDKFMMTNLRKDYLDTMKSINEWKSMNYEIKKISPKLLGKYNSLVHRYNQVDYLVKLYNGTLSQWTEEENILFEFLLDETKTGITNEGKLIRITWLTESIDKYYDDCFKNIRHLQDVTLNFQNLNKEIDICFHSISTILLVQSTNDTTYKLNEFKEHLKNGRNNSLEIIEQIFTNVIEAVNRFKGMIEYNKEVPSYWEIYMENIGEKFVNSFVKNVRKSLVSALRFFQGDGITYPEPLIFIDTGYIIDRIIFHPNIDDINDVLSQIIPSTQEIYENDKLSVIFKLCKKFLKEKRNFIELDSEIIGLKNKINYEVEMAMKTLNHFIESTNILQDILNIKNTLTQLKEDTGNYDKNTLESAIVRCEKISESTSSINEIININFLSINTVGMKLPLIEQCDLLKDSLFVELSKIIAAELALQR